MPSTSVKCAPDALATWTGKPPGHLLIQLIGTPPGSTALARSKSARERGCPAAKESCSAAISSARCARSTLVMAERSHGPRRRLAATTGLVHRPLSALVFPGVHAISHPRPGAMAALSARRGRVAGRRARGTARAARGAWGDDRAAGLGDGGQRARRSRLRNQL